MAIHLKTLGLKFAKYREQLCETVEATGSATGIDSDRLSRIEAGQLEPTGDEVLILADHFKCDYKFFISNDNVAPFEETETLYRAANDEFTPADKHAIQEFLYLCDTEAFLIGALRRSRPVFELSTRTGGAAPTPELAAAQARAASGQSNIRELADIYKAARELGVRVFRRKLGSSNISGLFVVHPVAGKCILVNSSEDIYRQRFSAAHELAHALFDADQSASVSLKSVRGDQRETRANKFASNFLLPKALLEKLPTPQRWSEADAEYWANKLKVSCAALAYALKSARIINSKQCDIMAGYRVSRERKVDQELPSSLSTAQLERKSKLLDLGLSDFYVEICFDAFQAHVISLGRLCEALLCSSSEVAELSSLYGRSINVL
jgi:Zn-dependent peptidase ImmA (M78 family)/transcriptional regulator with XRE-family HTH domain